MFSGDNPGYISPRGTPTPSSYGESPFFPAGSGAEGPVRCNSLGLGAMSSSRTQQTPQPMLSREMQSTSMVDLPMTMAISTDQLDQISEGSLPTKKSQSVPRLTFMTISNEGDRIVGGEAWR